MRGVPCRCVVVTAAPKVRSAGISRAGAQPRTSFSWSTDDDDDAYGGTASPVAQNRYYVFQQPCTDAPPAADGARRHRAPLRAGLLKHPRTAAAALATALAAIGIGVTVGAPWSFDEDSKSDAVLPLEAGPAPTAVPAIAAFADQSAPTEPPSGGVCPAQLAGPLALVPGVTSVVSRTCGADSAVVEFAIAGKANAATGSAAARLAGDVTARPARYLRLVASFPSPGGPPGWKTLPAAMIDDDSVVLTQTTLAVGVTARVTTPVKDNGLVRVEWIGNGTYYQLLSDRGWTPDGTTGLPATAVVAMAKTLA